MKRFCFLIIFCSFAGMLFARDLQDAYSAGYKQGLVDQQARVDFNYRTVQAYQTDILPLGCEARLAYIEGYGDGYFRRPSRENEFAYEVPGHPAVREPLPPPGFVTVFDEEDFKGRSRAFELGRYSKLTGDWNDDIESLRLTGSVRVILYDKEDFSGEKLVVERDTADLGDFHNKPASMIVERMTEGFVTAYKEVGYEGASREFEIGPYPELEDDWDDNIESIQLSGDVRVILFDKKNFEGTRIVVEQDLANLGEFRNKAASMVVEPIHFPSH